MAHSSIILDWNDNPGLVQEYRIYRGTLPGNEAEEPYAIVPGPASTFEDNAVIEGRMYSYVVTAVSNGIESENSLEVFTSCPVHFTSIDPDVIPMGSPLPGFAILAGSTITVVPGETVTVAGDVGVWPGTSITGFDAPSAISGVFHAGDFVAQSGQNELTVSYNDAVARTGATVLPADIGGMRLLPGVYSVATSLAITGTLILDANMDPSAAWIFQIGTTLTTAVTNSNVVLINGARAQKVFWQVGSSATLGGSTTFAGTIMAQASITVGDDVNVNGRLLARVGAVTFAGDASVVLFLIDDDCLQPLPPSPPTGPPPPTPAPTGLVITNEDCP